MDVLPSSFEPDLALTAWDCEEWDENEKLRKEKESLGFYITGHPLDRFKSEVTRFATSTIQDLASLSEKKSVSVPVFLSSNVLLTKPPGT